MKLIIFKCIEYFVKLVLRIFERSGALIDRIFNKINRKILLSTRNKRIFFHFLYNRIVQLIIFCRKKLVLYLLTISFFWYLTNAVLGIFYFFLNILRLFFSTFFFEKQILKMLKKKKIIVFKGGLGNGKDLLLYYFYKKLSFNFHNNSQKKEPRFLLSSSKENKIIDIFKREEISRLELINEYENGSYEDIIYEIGDENFDKNNEEKFMANKIAKNFYLNDNLTIFFSCFSKGPFSKKIESFANCEIFCKGYHETFFGNYVVLCIEIKKSCLKFHRYDAIWKFAFNLLTGKKIFLRKSFFEEFIYLKKNTFYF